MGFEDLNILEEVEPTIRDWERFYKELGALGIVAGPPDEEEWPGDGGPWPDEDEEDPRGGR